MLLAGLLWCVAGGMVTWVGLPLMARLAPAQPVLVPLAVVVFAASSGVVPEALIAFFYAGLGLALFACGLRFLAVFARGEVLLPVPEPGPA